MLETYPRRLTTLTILLLFILTALPVVAQDDYKTYEPRTTFDTLFTVAFLKSEMAFSFTTDDGLRHRLAFDRSDLTINPGQVLVDDVVLFDDVGLVIDGIQRSLSELHDVRINYRNDTTYIVALSRTASSSRLARLRQGNRIEMHRAAIVSEAEFVRGLVFCVTGDVEVYGEVNKDVISLFGDVYVGPEAVVRGDMVSITGQIDVAPDASVYGESYTARKRRRSYRSHLATHYDRFSTQVAFGYNRVDGFSAWWGQKYEDDIVSVPTFWGRVGYAFASERWRFDLGIEQDLWRRIDLKVGGRYYRDLASDDDWVIAADENSITSILARKDYKDWWETEGSEASISLSPMRDLELAAGYNNVKNRWLEAHHNLWALFGGDPFPNNFDMVDSTSREAGIAVLNGSIDGFLELRINYDTRVERHLFDRSAWHFTGRYMYSHPDLDSDFDYSRYMLTLRRYQRIDRHKMLILRGVYGDSEGKLPMHRLFYLGGIGTLRGYDRKELSGNRFFLTNAEIRQSFPRTDLAVSLHYDAGAVDWDNRFSADQQSDPGTEFEEVKQSLGVSLYLGNDLKISAAKRLDRSENNSPELYVRFSHKL